MTPRALLGLVLFLGGCGLDVGAPGAWVPADQIDAPLTIEVNAAPPRAVRAAVPAGGPVRVVTYNIDQEDPAIRAEDLAAAIAGSPELAGAAVILVQEAEHYPGEPTSRIAELAQRLGLNYVYVPAHIRETDAHTHGSAILSPYPIENVAKKDLPMAGPAQRIAVEADIRIGDRLLHVVDVHLEMRANAATRLAQLRPAVIDAPPATVVTGDFNMSWIEWAPPGVPVLSGTSAVDQAPAIDAYMAALGFATPTVGSGPTATAYGFTARVDAVFVRGLDVTFGGVVHAGPSDHWPMWVDVALP
jgi:endonuclease/exonuclease/phosphatase family metal-dependent hydrolase